MTIIAPVPLFLSDSTFTVTTDDYAAAISSVVFTPKSTSVQFKGLKPTAIFNFATPSEWTCDLTFAQDWDTAGSLSNYLFANEGSAVEVSFVPNDGGPTVTATVIVIAGSIGGSVGTVGTSTVSLGVNGAPVITPA